MKLNIKIMVKKVEVFEFGYLKNSCEDNNKGKSQCAFSYHVDWKGKGVKVVRVGRFIFKVHKIMSQMV